MLRVTEQLKRVTFQLGHTHMETGLGKLKPWKKI